MDKMKNVNFYPLKEIASSVLKPIRDGAVVATETVTAESLWSDKPSVIFAMRRPGCVLCRDTAHRLETLQDQLKALDVRLICLVHEAIPREIKAFQPTYWKNELYFDESKQFYKALGDGVLRRKTGMQVAGAMFTRQFWSRVFAAQKTIKDHNATGDGMTMGGLLVVKKGGETIYRFKEEDFGDNAPLEEVLEAARVAAGQK